MEFVKDDLLLKEDDKEEPYRRRNDEEKTSISWGQRKLLLTLVSFLIEHVDDNSVIVYAGAAPGINIKIAAHLFPTITFHLYDPAAFKIKTDLNKRIIVYRKKFTNKVAKYWEKYQKQNGNVYFISDIRTADYTKAKDLNDNEKQILTDMEKQKGWVNIIQPEKAHLKFRLPYIIPDLPETIDYFDGIVYKQPYSPQTSTETRLVCSPPYNLKTYSCEKYQSQMFHHNVIVRETYKYTNVYSGEELIDDYDSCYEVEVWEQYTGNHIINKTITELSDYATKMLTVNRKYQDTLSYLRSHPRAIKDRNFI